MSHDAQTLLPAFVCELLDADDAQAVQAHLADCPACATERDQWTTALGALDVELEPPPEVWDAIEEALAVEILSEAVDLTHLEPQPGDQDPLEPLAADPDSLKRTFGPYEVVEDVSQSPRAVLYRVLREGHATPLALKVHREGPLLPRLWVERFLHDAQALIKLEHPGLATVREVGRHQGFPFFTRDWIPGQSLADLLAAAAPPPPCEVLHAVAEAAEGLHAAHAHGVLHRGLRPENLIVGPRGGCVVDFALEPGGDLRQRLAAADALPGDPRYQAPEQVRGEGVDRRADVYGLGAVLLHALSGVAPFEADSGHELVERILSEPAPRLRARALGLSPDVARVVAACLAKDPAQRYASARRLAEDLHRCLRGEPLAGPDPRARLRRRRRARWGAGLLGLALVGGVAAWQLDARITDRDDAAWETYTQHVESGLDRAAGQIQRARELGASPEAAALLDMGLRQLDRSLEARAFGGRADEEADFRAGLAPRVAAIRADAYQLRGDQVEASAEPAGAVDWWLRAWDLRRVHSRPAWGWTQALVDALVAADRADEALDRLRRSGGPPASVAWRAAQIQRQRGDRAGERAALDATLDHGTTGDRGRAALLRRAELSLEEGQPYLAQCDLHPLGKAFDQPAAVLLARAQASLGLGLLEEVRHQLFGVAQPESLATILRGQQQAQPLSSRGLRVEAGRALAAGELDEALRGYAHLHRLQREGFAAWAAYGRALDLSLDYEGAHAAYAHVADAPTSIVPGLAPDPANARAWLRVYAADPVLAQLEAEHLLQRLGLPAPPDPAQAGATWRRQELAHLDGAASPLPVAVAALGPAPRLPVPSLRTLLQAAQAQRERLRADLRTRSAELEAQRAAHGAAAPALGDPLVLRALRRELVRALVVVGRLNLDQGWAPRASDALDEARALDPDAVEVHAAMAELARAADDDLAWRAALERAQRSLEAGAGELGGIYQRGLELAARRHRGELDALLPALRAFLRVHALAPGQPWAALEAARLLAAHGRPQLALELLARAERAAPDMPETWLERGFLWLGRPLRATTSHAQQAIDVEAAAAAFGHVLARRADVTHHAEARYGLARVALSRGQRTDALQQLELAWRSYPTDLELAGVEDLVRQREILELHLALDPDARPARARSADVAAACAQRAHTLATRADQERRGYDHTEALASLDQALRLLGDDPLRWAARGEAQLRAGHKLGGMFDLCRAVNLDPWRLPDLERGRWSEGFRADWLRDAPRWLAHRPGDVDLRLAVGLLALDQARRAATDAAERTHALRARDALDQALALDPELVIARMLRGEARGLIGDQPGAEADMIAVQGAAWGIYARRRVTPPR